MNPIGILREIKESELILMLEWRNHPSIRANMYNQHEITLDEHLKWWNLIKESKHNLYFMYEYQDKKSGILGFTEINNFNKNSMWAFYASPEAARGTGTRMEYLALEYAFNDLNLNKLNCEVLAFNPSVIKLHKKFGFKEEGVFREQYQLNSSFFDIHRLGILKREWEIKQEKMEQKILLIAKR